MPYINLARKYRPQRFEDLLGQETVQKTLKNAIASGKIAQAYLFAGPRGVGKTSAARILAKALNCEKGPTPEPCNRCAVCNEITAGTSMDVIEIDGASHTQVDNVREIRDAVKYMPTRGIYKVYIIDEVHMLSQAAFNALLKTLEEPPPHTVFIMATTEPRKVPLTVLSRCQRYEFRPLQIEVSEQRVKEISGKEGIDVDDESVRLIARRADGSLRDALSLLEQVVSYGGESVSTELVREVIGFVPRESIFEFTEALLERSSNRLLGIVDQLYSGGYELKMLLEALIAHLRNLALIHVSPELLNLLPGERKMVEEQSRKADPEVFIRLIKEFLRVYDVVSRSAYPKFSLEAELLSLTAINPVSSAREIMRKLDEMGIAKGLSLSKSKDTAEDLDVKKKVNTTEMVAIDWDSFVEEIRENTILSAILKRGKAGDVRNGVLKLYFPESDRRLVSAQAEEIGSALKNFTGKRLEIDFQWLPEEKEHMPTNEELKKEEIEDELVKEAINIFDAQIYDIKISRE